MHDAATLTLAPGDVDALILGLEAEVEQIGKLDKAPMMATTNNCTTHSTHCYTF
jgi:hypothetical protein